MQVRIYYLLDIVVFHNIDHSYLTHILGQFLGDKRHGHGTYTPVDGSSYVGEYYVVVKSIMFLTVFHR